MVQMNFARKEVKCKIVYYGPGLSGKTTNIEVIHDKAPSGNRGELTSIATEGDRTLFFDFMPLDLGKVHGMDTKFKLYTVPGQVYYNSTRKLVLQGADGVVFVADSQRKKLQENIESLENLKTNLAEYGLDIATIPLILQYNKRDLPDIMSVEEMNEKMNPWGCPHFEAVAFQGVGVFPTLKTLVGMVLEKVNAPASGGGTVGAPPKRPTGAAIGAPGITSTATPPPTDLKKGSTPFPTKAPGFGGAGMPQSASNTPIAPKITSNTASTPTSTLPPRPGGMAPPPPRPGGMAPPPRPGGMTSPSGGPPLRPGGMTSPSGGPPPRPGGVMPPPSGGAPRPGGVMPLPSGGPPRPGGIMPPPKVGAPSPQQPLRPGGTMPPISPMKKKE